MRFRSVQQIEQYFVRQDHRRNDHYQLVRMQQAVIALAHPELQYKTIHVGGTSGKGSTSQMMYSILRAAGYTVGLYSSPTLVSTLERIKVNEKIITAAAVVRLVNKHWSVLEKLNLTYFELFTLVSLLFFAERQVDFAVVEVGVGGVSDATNIIQPIVAIVTDVGIDHVNLLGKTKQTIARKKAAIIKPGAIGFTGSRYVKAGTYIDLTKARIERATLNGTVFSYRQWKRVYLNLLGTYQVRNAVLALMATQALRIPVVAQRRGLRSVFLPARFQLVGTKPTIIADGAHNPQKMRAFVRSVRVIVPARDYRQCTVLLSLKYTKDALATLRPIAALADTVIVTGFDESMSLKKIRQALLQIQPTLPVKIIAHQAAAYRHFQKSLQPDGLGIITGSLYMIGNLMRAHLL